MSGGNLYLRFEQAFAAHAERIAIRTADGRECLTFGELARGAARYANALAALGVTPGDRVTVQVEKSVANVLLYLAVMKAGAVYQPLNTAYTAAEVSHFVEDAQPKLIVCDPSRQAMMRALADAAKVFAVVNLNAEGNGSLATMAATMDDRHETVTRDGDDLAGLLYTSGTTGRSKGAMITHANLESNARALVDLWRMTPDDTLLHALPVFHVHGLYVALNTAFLSAASIIWFNKLDTKAMIAAMPRATLMMGVPTFYTRLLSEPSFTRETARNMRLFISGSAPLLAETHTAFAQRTGHAILERYGMTETGMIASNPYDGARLAGTVGFALPDVSVRVRGEQPGVLEVKGPNVFKGYWRMPEKTREDFTPDRWFITGDVGSIDVEGRVSIVGRAKDLIISGGFNVYPREIEEVLDALPGICESAVIGVPHPDFGEGVVAVVTAEAKLPPEAEIVSALSSSLAKFKVPKRIFEVAELPRNAIGKVQKAELRKRYAGTFGSPIIV
ncbi:MAG: AMP-binding protein [Aestuariivirga sp.]|uniref:AMP-binding protein n=1 Tax=Aestuariivirga sp. TaxID=2650926 RepID=UPI0025C3B427|nr:AMP-binding protein [Aestuariivirga sp.]MCA3561924.1 AMP-binding protein [Aestuariivirga sp.]